MKQAIQFTIFLLLLVLISACGETVRGVGKDVSRVGRGVRTIFVS